MKLSDSSNDDMYGGTCNATGRLYNDDGLTTNLTTDQNRFQFNFSSKCEK